MPYRLKPSNSRKVQVFVNGAWRDLRTVYKNKASALSAMSRLRKSGHR